MTVGIMQNAMERASVRRLQGHLDRVTASSAKAESRKNLVAELAAISAHHLEINHLGERVQLAFGIGRKV